MADVTLRELAVGYANGKYSTDEVKIAALLTGSVELVRDGEESWYEGDQDNTMVAVQALVGDEMTQEQFQKFVELMSFS